MVLAAAGVLDGRRATSYPGFLKDASGTTVTDEAVVSDAGIITSRGPGTALDFALALVAELAGPAASSEVEAALRREATPQR
jgi:4-methyl-5(b-hydroxyethyl)-thiazole monophosphate biosynthesis